jgi:hypothetical protein
MIQHQRGSLDRTLAVAFLALLVLTMGLCTRQIITTPLSCARMLSSTITPKATTFAPGQEVRVDWNIYNCGSTDWAGLRFVRTAGNLGPDSFAIGSWPPGTAALITLESKLPTTPGRYSVVYQLQTPNGPIATFLADLEVVPQH